MKGVKGQTYQHMWVTAGILSCGILRSNEGGLGGVQSAWALALC